MSWKQIKHISEDTKEMPHSLSIHFSRHQKIKKKKKKEVRNKERLNAIHEITDSQHKQRRTEMEEYAEKFLAGWGWAGGWALNQFYSREIPPLWF